MTIFYFPAQRCLKFLLIPLLAMTVAAGSVYAAGEQIALAELPRDLTELSLSDLMNIEVTTVSRGAEPLHNAAAAIFVLTGDEIHRSGVRSIAEALRQVPGLHVARNGDINTHAISSRGFAGKLSDKLEVLIDGRTVYTPLFSGVFWDNLDTLLPDIDRIEVIRGPGATLYGANAVNGVINIVTKSAADTTGQLFRTGVGTEERSFASLRSGTAVGNAGHARLYVKHFERDALKMPDGGDAPSDQQMGQAGFRSDWNLTNKQQLTVSGDLFNGVKEDTTGDTDISGGNVLGRWALTTAKGSELAVQAYYDHSKRFIPQAFRERRDIGSLEMQHRVALGSRNTLVYGAGYRNSHDTTGGPPLAFNFTPASETLHYYQAFVQDQIRLAGGRGELTLGSKFEHNEFTGAELHPNIRLGWQLSGDVFTWGAVSRAVRTPNRVDDALTVLGVFRSGNPEQTAEKLIAYEWGLRYRTAETFSGDLALFYNDYDDLRSSEPQAGNPFGRFGNGIKGHGGGGELSLAWQPARTLDLRLSYSYLDLQFQSKPGSGDSGSAAGFEGGSPEHQAGLRVDWQPAPRWQVNSFLRYVAELPALNVPAYSDLNLRVAYRPLKSLELAVVGENLLDRQHLEFQQPSQDQIERSGLFELTWAWN